MKFKAMKALTIFILFFNFLGLNVFSQQCGYDKYYLFAIHAHAPNSSGLVSNLKMYLVNEEDNPILTPVSYFEDNQWKHRNDTLLFWEHNRLKPEPGKSPLFRQKYFNLGDYYVVVFKLDNNQVNNPESHPIYKVKIEANSNIGPHETMLVHLPLQKALRICNNGITNDFPLTKPLKTLDGKTFEPIDIALDQSKQAMEVEQAKGELHYTVRFDYQTLSNQYEGMSEYLLNGARIYNTQTGKLHQEIYIPRITKSSSKESKYIVKFIDFYNRGITEAQDFSVQIETWRDLEHKCYRQKLNYYIFNTTTKKYELDTALSNYNDVFFYEPQKTIRRYDLESSTTSRITYTYQLENKKWVLIDKNEAFFEPPAPKIKFPSSNCIAVNEKSHTLPLKAVIGNHTKLLVKDTFWLYNVCEDTLYITQVQSASKDFFSINQTLLPKQATPLIFNGFLSHQGYDFNINYFNCALTLTDGSMIPLGIAIPTVSNNATVYYRADSSISYAIANTPKARFSTAVFTYADGKQKAVGKVQDKDTSLKVGKWLYFKPEGIGSDDVVYSKAVSLSAFDDIHGNQHNNFKVKVLENGTWKEPIMDAYKNEIKFYISPKTDSILAYTDTTSFGFRFSYKKIPVDIKKEFYLLKPGERTLKIGYYETPFNVLNNQYALILNYNRFKLANRTSYQLTDSLIAALQKQYPGIATVWISKNQRGINLQNLEHETKEKVLQQLVRDSSIAFICQLYYTHRNQQRLGYCNNRVYADMDLEDEEKFRKRALKLGFSDIEIDMGNNRFWLTYPNKLIDERFFETFDRLTRENIVFGAYFNAYFEPELDYQKGD